jgi:hypothetical protein
MVLTVRRRDGKPFTACNPNPPEMAGFAKHKQGWYGLTMARKKDLRALRNVIAEAQDIVNTTELPEGRSARLRELLASAVFLADDLLEQSPAATLGAKGGKKTAKRGSDYFRKIAAMRKEKKGGRPPKPN